jgi:spermidine synthase
MVAPDRRGQAVLPDGPRPAAHVRDAPDLWLLAAAFSGSLCLFLLELFAGKFLLPRFGGAPSVWVSCLAFFQVALVAGYFFADRVGRISAPRIQFAVIAGLFAITALATVVIARQPDMLAIGDGVARAIAVPLVLTCTVGPTFFTLATLAPLLGHWHAQHGRHDRGGGPDTGDVAYRLYAGSNAGSFLALVAYPFAIENVAGLSRQAEILAGLFLLVAALTLTAGWRLTRHAPRLIDEQAMRSEPAVGWRRWLRWAVLAAIPASWLSSITTYATAEVAPIPLLWIVPLAIYLASFVVVFAANGRDLRRFEPTLAIAAIVAIAWLLGGNVREPTWAVLVGHCIAFFMICVALHGLLVDSRPPAGQLTVFSLAMATGGALGGLFNALVAPLLFDAYHEFPLVVAAAAGVIPPVARSWSLRPRLSAAVAAAAGMATAAGMVPGLPPSRSLWLVAIGAAALVALFAVERRERAVSLAIVLLAAFWMIEQERQVLYRTRTFFGVLRVEASDNGPSRELVHGTIRHGVQLVSSDPDRRRIPLAYYHPTGPLGSIFAALEQSARPGRVGVAGLGVGTVAAYAQPGQEFVFFEIDPAIVAIARNPKWFSYLADTAGRCRIVVDDARIALAREPDHAFDLLVIDAFTGDSVPTHLLTREALNLYGRKLKADGILAVHISNRYLDFAPIIAALAAEGGWMALDGADRDVPEDFARLASRWMALTRSLDIAKRVYSTPTSPRWQWQPSLPGPRAPVWTDDRTSVREALFPATTVSTPAL